MWPVGVVKLLELAQCAEQVCLVQIRVQSSSSRRQVCTQLSTIAFILGTWTCLVPFRCPRQ
jgi:hypothetical protein